MKKYFNRFLGLIVAFAMILSSLPLIDIISFAESNESEISKTIEGMKNYYREKKDEYNYLEAMTLKSLGASNDVIQGKLKIEELSDSTSKEYAKAIMGLIAAGFDPTNYDGKDYIRFLTSSQTKDGYFETKNSAGDSADDLAYSIIALDMAGAEYDVAKAVNKLEEKFTVEGNEAFVKKWSFSSSGDLELTAISMIALSNHKDIIDTDLIDKAIKYIKSEKLSCGMYGVIDCGQEKVSAKLTSKMVQALVAAGEIIPDEMLDGLLNLRSGNEFKENESSVNEYATSEVFAALTDIYTEKSMFKEVKVKVGEADTVEIVLPEGQNSIKVGKTMQLSAKTYDENKKYIASQNYKWSSNNTEVATVDEKGIVTGHKIGTTTINVKVSGFEDVEKSIQIEVIGVEPNSIDLKVDGDLSEIEVGRKVKIDAEVLDADKQKVEKVDIQWEVMPKDLVELNAEGVLTALKPGNVTITASVQKNTEETLSENINLKIVTKQEKIDNALKEVKDGIIANPDKYGYTTAMGLRLTGTNIDEIVEKASKYSYSPNTNTRAKDIMMAIAIGKDPKDYHDKNYVQEILDSDFYNDENPEWLANGIIALDMAGAKYDETRAVNALIDKLEKNAGKYYIKNKNNNKPNTELTALTLIALSKHSELEGASEAIEGIKSYLKSIQDENALIENCKNHSLAIQALIASGEDIYSEGWTKQDKYGNKITLLDALLSLKQGAKFKVNPDNKYPKSGQEVYAFAALVDLSTNKSMYHEVKYTGPKEYTIQIETDSKDLILNQGNTLKLEAKVLENGKPVDKEIIWESLDDSIVQVNDGEIKALKEGQTKVRAKIKFFEHIYDEVNITVKKVVGKAEKIVIKDIGNTPVIKGDKFKLEADVLDGNGNGLENNELEWTSSDSNIASVDENGNVVAHKAGSVEISGKIKDTDINDIITINIFENEKVANNTIDKFIEAVKVYYETDYYRESQGSLNAWETATFVRAGMNLDKWHASNKYQSRYDVNLKNLASKANQALIMLDIGENPADFNGRNLIVEIVEELNKSDYGHGDQNYLKAVIAVDRYNEKYKDQKVVYDEKIVIDNILLAQTKEGGFKERETPVPMNTGYALKALSKHRDYSGVDESINKALKYLHSIQKDDGGFYTGTYVTGFNAEVISGLLAVGEDLTSEKWSKGDSNPIESLFILWKDNKSFDNKEGESTNNKGWIDATQKALYTLVDLKDSGYSNYVVKTASISNKQEEPEKICNVYTAIVVGNGEKYEMKSEPKLVKISTKEHKGGLTALGALQATTSLYKFVGNTVTSIYGIENKGIGGWMFSVNGKIPNVGAKEVELNEGDKVIWFYSPEGMDGKSPQWDKLKKEDKDNDKEFEIEYIGDTEVRNGQQANAKVKMKNLTAETKPATLIVALYDKSTNRLLNYSIVKKDLESKEELKLTANFLVPETGDYYIKVFLWDNLKDQNTIMQDVKEIKVAK
ncbi:Ig-like domain-containing protein [Anaerosalibacter bizertensis]|uniref:Ig-like domain-containing protein n=1 Tax=Anaerosalibacter bizertensis TaxID=932217 RepID=A0A9Q4AEM0_9FIRM|nr:Ig-like domain-containing protein [Anaerosalibacter bizertensis]MBV1820468.1 Ig-like domain-containing protein [Bacteroidales bacterium MSK.15.36]MCB5560561.1 Ig-like domain-containing protein [Anaerosalibacter bizertensis]MCG4566027.1 Ig-like domain-containing protein [Anaerosalibacter bizertensis]MCG4583431.1 Ig-like domain-containing protein [Anaerosalibacter bizertensis]MCG4584319.1 Ig-like domain-containing protein [Anaerosalibacter bizertensis]